jgi:hypothetical protein
MPDQLQLRGGTTAEHSTFTGAIKEVTVDTTKKTAVVHDGTTAGGIPLLRQDGSNSALALGSVGTPSLKWDANTGIYSPGEDQLAVATNGTGRLFVDASGLVGIGNSSPAEAKLCVNGGISIEGVYSNYKANIFTMDNNGGSSRLNSFGPNITTPGSFDFAGYSSNASVGTTRMFISSAGLVGIGTTSPKSILTTQGNIVGLSETTHSLQHYQQAAASYTVTSIDSVISGASGSLVFKTAANWTNGNAVEQARIDSSGRLLVGTIASPAHQLQVSTDSAGKPSTNTWTIVSDERIKEEIELADLDLCYQAVKTIPLKRFKWKDEVYTEEQVRDRRKLGWIAQDVEAVFPKAVGTYEFKYNQVFEETIIPAIEEELDGEGNVTTPAQPERIGKGELISEDVIEDCRDLNSDQLYAAMYGAIQKLMVKVETLETELAALKAS